MNKEVELLLNEILRNKDVYIYNKQNENYNLIYDKDKRKNKIYIDNVGDIIIEKEGN